MKRSVALVLGGAAVAVVGTIATVLTIKASVAPINPDPTWLQQQLVALKPAAWKPLNFCAQHTRGSYDNPEEAQNPPAVLQAELAFLQSMGVQSVRVDIGYDAYAESDTAVISAIDGLVASIKGSQKLVIADASREYYRKNPEPWAQFQTDWIARVTDLAGRYQPYAYLVIKEPGWYAAMISDAKTNPLVQEPSSWVSLLSELNAAVKSVSPGTLT